MGQERKPGQGISWPALTRAACEEARRMHKATVALDKLSTGVKLEEQFIEGLLKRLDLTGQCIVSGSPFAWYLMQGGRTINEEFPCRTKDVAYQLAKILQLEVQEG